MNNTLYKIAHVVLCLLTGLTAVEAGANNLSWVEDTFEDFADGMKQLYIGNEAKSDSEDAQNENTNDDLPEKSTEVEKENNTEVGEAGNESDINQKINLKDKTPSEISSKINRFLTSGIAPSEKKINLQPGTLKINSKYRKTKETNN